MDRVLFTVEEESAEAELDVERTPRGLARRRIFVQTLDGQRVPVEVDGHEAVEDIPMKVFEKEPFLQRFAGGTEGVVKGPRAGPKLVDPRTGHTLERDHQVTAYGLEQDTTLNLVLQRYPTYADWLQYKTKLPRFVFVFLAALVGSLVLAACAQVSFLPPWSDEVPVTGQTFGVLFTAVLLGKTIGVLATVLYLVEGVVLGLPFFSSSGHGWASLLGPTGGYLEGFILAAWVVGYLVENHGWDRRLITACLAMIIGDLSIYVVGIPWLAHFIGWSDVWESGFYPFLAGDAFKILLATLLLPVGWALRAYRYNRTHSSALPIHFRSVGTFFREQFTIPEVGVALARVQDKVRAWRA